MLVPPRFSTSMKALQLEKPAGGAQRGQRHVVAVRHVPLPTVGEDMVLVKVGSIDSPKILAAGMNRRDEWSALGLYPGLVFENATLGCDGCGILVNPTSLAPLSEQLYLLVPSRGWDADEAGPEAALPHAPAHLFKNEFGGQGFGILGATRPVCGVGTFCEYVAVHRSQLVPAPAHLSAVQSAALPCAAVTAYRALFTKGRVAAGQNVLITGIGGGVAIQALQMALAAGATVLVTGGSSAKVERARAMGAHGGALYKDADWPDQVRALLPPSRPWIDVVIDSAGGNIVAQALQAGLRDGGKVVVFGMTAAPNVSLTMRDVLKNVDLQGSTLGSAREFRASIEFIEAHHLVPNIDTVLPGLEHASEGLARLADAEQRSGGKVVIDLQAAHTSKVSDTQARG